MENSTIFAKLSPSQAGLAIALFSISVDSNLAKLPAQAPADKLEVASLSFAELS